MCVVLCLTDCLLAVLTWHTNDQNLLLIIQSTCATAALTFVRFAHQFATRTALFVQSVEFFKATSLQKTVSALTQCTQKHKTTISYISK